MNEDYDFKEISRQWWRRIQHDTGGLAKLRHQSDLIGIESIDCFYDYVAMAGKVNIDVLAAIAMVLSHVEFDAPKSAAWLMGKGTKNSEHAVSELRFNKLMSLNLSDAARELVRILPLIDSSADVGALANDLRYWDSEKQFSKKKWLNDYYMSNRKE